MQESHSSLVTSSQTALHPQLAALVTKHTSTQWRQPLHKPTIEAFAALLASDIDPEQKIVLDSGCGTGVGTRHMAELYPDCLVIGVDKSKARLQKIPGSRFSSQSFIFREGNIVWLRAELASFWRLALQAGWHLHRHYLLYPNPWPKPGQILRRWHAHPVFPVLLKLGGQLELRCNWELYAREFATAAEIAACLDAQLTEGVNSAITTPFEDKYRNSGQKLYRVVIQDVADHATGSKA